MVKRIVILSLALLLAFAGAGCGQQAEEQTKNGSDEVDAAPAAQAEEAEADNSWGLTLSTKDVSPTGLTLVMTQSGGQPTGELMCGSDYQLERVEGALWLPVPYAIDGDVAWTSEAYLIPMEGSTEMELGWSMLYGALGPGLYRVSKYFMDFRGTGDYDTAVAYAEFELQ